MSLNSSELSLDLKPPTYVPKTISQFLGDVSRIGSVSEKIMKVDVFLNKLETEMKKIDAFKRELPLSMLLINDAIATLKMESMLYKEQNLHSRPVLAEFIPLEKGCDEDEKDEISKYEDDTGDKRDWLSSTQLWGTDDNKYSGSNPNNNQKTNSVEETPKRVDGEDQKEIDDPFQAYRNSGRAFLPFKGYSPFPAASTITRKEGKEELPVVPLPGLSLITPAIKNPVVEIGASSLISKASTSRIISCSIPPNVHSGLRTGPLPPQQQASRKQRRCWSPELHRRFVSALQQLGGSQAATPKQIRELMQVEGLTNDEVKSHLQKYRLHTRRVPSSSGHSPPNLWTGQEKYAESSKQSNNSSHSHSPEGPLQLATGTMGDSMDYDDDEKSESCCWKTHLHTSAKVAAA